MINTILIWLLISLPKDGHQEATPATTVAQFATLEECQRVRSIIDKHSDGRLMCLQAHVVK
jgi:hypothetical protein